jgi:hypothetical protein
MTNTKNIEMGLELLETLLEEDAQITLRNKIAELVEVMGFNACAREVRNNRRAKENALYAFNNYYRNITGDRINLETRETFKIPAETIAKADEMKRIFVTLTDKLESNTPKQLEYMKLKLEYENATFKLAELFKDHDELYTDRSDEQIQRIRDHGALIDEQSAIKKQLEDELDRFIFANIK